MYDCYLSEDMVSGLSFCDLIQGVWLWDFGRTILGTWLRTYGFGGMVLGSWFWAYGFGCMVWLWAYGFWADGFGSMVLGIWLWAYGLALGIWFSFGGMVLSGGIWAYGGFGCMVLGVRFGFGRIVWMYDLGGTALQTRAGQAQKYILILNRKIND